MCRFIFLRRPGPTGWNRARPGTLIWRPHSTPRRAPLRNSFRSSTVVFNVTDIKWKMSGVRETRLAWVSGTRGWIIQNCESLRLSMDSQSFVYGLRLGEDRLEKKNYYSPDVSEVLVSQPSLHGLSLVCQSESLCIYLIPVAWSYSSSPIFSLYVYFLFSHCLFLQSSFVVLPVSSVRPLVYSFVMRGAHVFFFFSA